jgi:hypothetical protein
MSLSLDHLKQVLDYNPQTGVFVWKVSTARRIVPGTVAGTVNSKGYRVIQLFRKLHTEHRLAWFYVTGVWPSDQIDHINQVKTDNRFENLREATNSQNSQNSKIRRNNTSGYKGVSWWAHREKWAAQMRVDGKNRLLGMFDNPLDAHLCYQSLAKIVHTHRPGD